MTGFLTAVAFLIALASIVAGGALGVWLARRIHLTLPPTAEGRPFSIDVFRAMTWWLRILVFLVAVQMVSIPVMFLLQALLPID